MGLTPDAYCFVALHWYPRHPNGLVTTFRDAVFLASANVGPWQRGNSLFNFQAFYAADLDAAAASGTLARVHNGYPFGSHGSCHHWCTLGLYFTMIVPFIQGCG